MKKVQTQPQVDVTKYAVGIITLIVILSIGAALLFRLSYSEFVSTLGLLIATGAFYGVIYNMNYNSVQLQKALAKPKLELSFNENNDKEYKLDYSKGKIYTPLWITNTGNAITDLFQVDIYIPDVFTGGINSNIVDLIRYQQFGDYAISSMINKHLYVCFVNRSIQLPSLELKVKNDIQLTEEYEIRYRIYGDWAETQEGKLKIIVKKQETPNAG